MAEDVFSERDGDIATVIMNRPEKLNAFDGPTWDLFAGIVTELDRDDSIRCVVVRGVDATAFSAGSDISAWREHRSDPADVRAYSQQIADCLDATFAVRHPVIAAINGACMGGGMLIASVCDLRICGASRQQ